MSTKGRKPPAFFFFFWLSVTASTSSTSEQITPRTTQGTNFIVSSSSYGNTHSTGCLLKHMQKIAWSAILCLKIGLQQCPFRHRYKIKIHGQQCSFACYIRQQTRRQKTQRSALQIAKKASPARALSIQKRKMVAVITVVRCAFVFCLCWSEPEAKKPSPARRRIKDSARLLVARHGYVDRATQKKQRACCRWLILNRNSRGFFLLFGAHRAFFVCQQNFSRKVGGRR